MLQLIPKQLLGFLRLHAVAIAAIALLVSTGLANVWGPNGSWMLRGFTCLYVAGCLAYAIHNYRRLARDVSAITDAVRNITSTEVERPYISAAGDLKPLSKAMNRMFAGVTDRQQRLRQLADRMSTVLGAMVEGVLAVDDRQHVLFANVAAGKLLGFDPGAARGKGLLEVVRNHMLHEAVSETLANRNLPNQETRRYEFDSHQSHGQILAFRATRLQGNPCPGVVLVLQDVTELRRLEHLRQEFVANVSHELKTPLTAIKAYAETLLAGAIDEPEVNRSFIANIEREADRLNDLIADMLRLAKIESGHASFNVVSVDLSAAIRDCVHRHETRARRGRVALEFEDPGGSVLVRADHDGLRTVLDNLVDNAMKYTEPEDQVTLRWMVTNNGRVGILVSDTGLGIPIEHQSRVFERFFRVDQARSRELGSTGLGLAIVKHLSQAFGGSIAVCSVLGEGTTFRVLLLAE